MQNNQLPKTPQNTSETIGDAVTKIVESCQQDLVKYGIDIEYDFEAIYSPVDSAMLRTTTVALLQNAIQKMPHGGQITVTLIDGKHQWELEIADTSGMAFNPYESYDESTYLSKKEVQDTLPTIIPFPQNEYLRDAHRAALGCGSQIQTFDCPQGGTAHVLVVPKRTRTQQVPNQHRDCA